jgi:hypothetical protein
MIRAVVLALASVLLVVPGQAALADGCSSTTETEVRFDPEKGSVLGGGNQANEGCTSTSTVENIVELPKEPRDSNLDPICVATAMSQQEDPFEFCQPTPETEESVEITPSLVASILTRIEIPQAAIDIQPPNGRTLVNFETNFRTATTVFDPAPIVAFSRSIEIHLEAAEYSWLFGDGQSLTTSDPGAAYPDLRVTHSYLRKGTVSPRVDVRWVGTFRVDGGPSRTIPGSVTVAGTPVDLQVLTATPTLVGYE